MALRQTFTLLIATVGGIFLLSQGAPVSLTAAGSRPPERAVGVTKRSANRTLSIQSWLAAPGSRGDRAAQGGTNDSCMTPETIFDGPNLFSTVGNTTDGLPHVACQFDGQTYLDDWFVYVATCTDDLTVSTCDNADYDTDIVVYTGCQPVDWACPPGDAELLGCNDDAAECAGFTSEVIVPVSAGNCYTIRVGGWKGDDQGTGTLTLTCGVPVFCGDGILGPGEECDDGGTEPADCVKDFCESDCTGAICSVCPLCAGDQCENSPGSCHLNDRDGHGEGGIVGATSDLDSGFTVADNFVPTTDTVAEVCWWGIYIDFAGPFDCGPGKGDNFTVTYFTDVDGLPGGVIASYNLLGVEKTVSGFVPTGIGPVQTYGYSATHPAVSVTPNQCHWIEIVNDTTGSVCVWLWSTAAPGDGLGAQDINGNGYEPGEELDFDLAFCLDSKVGGDTVVYVDADATGLENGTSWPDAFTDLQDALDVASCAGAGSQVWVAASTQTYKPDRGSGDRTATFQLLSGVGVYGGFAGFESTLEERAGLFDQTILSGDIATPGDNSDNSYHVVTGSGVDETAQLDGFTITKGNANGAGADEENGGGMINISGSPTVRNCALTENTTQLVGAGRGGGVYNAGSDPLFEDCMFIGNAAQNGGGMRNALGSSPTLTRCLFEGNTADAAGGLQNTDAGADPIVTECQFVSNTALIFFGGAIGNHAGANPTLDGCTFTENSAASEGGAIYNGASSSMLNNCTFIENSAGESGGAIYGSESVVTLTNCEFISNTAAQFGGGADFESGSSVTVTDCLFQGNTATTNTGGGLAVFGGSTALISGSAFVGNMAGSGGGGIQLATSSVDPTIVNCTFVNNHASTFGGGVLLSAPTGRVLNSSFLGNTANQGGGLEMGFGDGSAEVTNCLFSGNQANVDPTSDGGAITIVGLGTQTLTNCTFVNNSANDLGGGIKIEGGSAEIANSVLWNNADGGGTNEASQIFLTGGTANVTYSLIQDLNTFAGTGNIDADPLFVDPDGADDMVGTPDDDLRLSDGSPCVDSADNNAVPADTTDLDDDGDTIEPIPFDLEGNDRFFDDPDTVDTGVGPAPVVDMGALEFFPDCNNNGIFDACDIDCGPKGGDCDVDGCGQSDDCNGNGLPDECEVPPLGPPEGDCNGNGVPDECDIADMTSDDCNGNGIPDECEFDCNGNGTPDDCDVDPADPDGNEQVSDDCNGNGTPDECEVPPIGPPENDCNGNGKPDECDVDPTDPDGNGEVSDDCNNNGTPDECELPVSSGGLCTEGCASDCDGNGVIDSCDLADCPPDTPSCDDCNVNDILDGCDVDPLDPDGDGHVSADGNGDGVPDECVEATGAGDWSGDIWGLGGDYPDNDPKNPSGVPDLSVTLDGADVTVFADVTVEIPSLRLINAASLDVTQAGDQGDLTILDPSGLFDGNLLIEGTLNISGQRMINAAGTMTIGTGGVYKSILGFEGPLSGDLMADAVVVECGGTLRLEGSMSLDTTGDFTMQAGEDDGKGDCTPPDFKAGDDSTTSVGGDFKIQGSAVIEYNSTQPLLLGGDFTNRSTAAETFDWSAGSILLNGPLHTIEAAGRERGPCPGGLANNFAFGSLALAEDTLVQIVDEFDNQGDGLTACDETVYVDLLEVSAGAILLTEGCRVYFKQLMLAEGGSIPGLGTDVLQILEGCPPDFSNDGVVGAFDLAILLGAWGLCPEPCTPGEPIDTCATDLSGDCVTGAFDLALLLGSWGPV